MPAEHRHHIKPLTERPDLLLDWSNHASLCSRCHHRVESLVRAGEPTEHLFEGEKRAHRLTGTTGAAESPTAENSDSEPRHSHRAPVGPGKSQRGQAQTPPPLSPARVGRGSNLWEYDPQGRGPIAEKKRHLQKNRTPGNSPLGNSP